MLWKGVWRRSVPTAVDRNHFRRARGADISGLQRRRRGVSRPEPPLGQRVLSSCRLCPPESGPGGGGTRPEAPLGQRVLSSCRLCPPRPRPVSGRRRGSWRCFVLRGREEVREGGPSCPQGPEDRSIHGLLHEGGTG